jgi:hypothetical protein
VQQALRQHVHKGASREFVFRVEARHLHHHQPSPGHASSIIEEAAARSIVWKGREINDFAGSLFDCPVSAEVLHSVSRV